jgi:phosphoribosylformimino-5-aminoimidazole carboxamide ribonucleotide (ProFAR) isomerase
MTSAGIYLGAGGLQIGGGINDQNAKEWLDAGASKVGISAYNRGMTNVL